MKIFLKILKLLEIALPFLNVVADTFSKDKEKYKEKEKDHEPKDV